jgi:hypothetical protein
MSSHSRVGHTSRAEPQRAMFLVPCRCLNGRQNLDSTCYRGLSRGTRVSTLPHQVKLERRQRRGATQVDGHHAVAMRLRQLHSGAALVVLYRDIG